LAGRALLKIVYLLVRPILGLAVLTARRDVTKDAEPLVLRPRTRLRRHADRVRYEPADRVWFAAGTTPPPQALHRIPPNYAATLLAWHRKLAAFFAPPDPVAERKVEARHDRTFDGRPMRVRPATLDELRRCPRCSVRPLS
jgi:hypothetical protein